MLACLLHIGAARVKGVSRGYNLSQELDHVLSCKTTLFLSTWRLKPMTKKRRRFSSEFKFRVALEAAKGQQTLGELASKHSLHPNQISQWKRQLLESGAEVFT